MQLQASAKRGCPAGNYSSGGLLLNGGGCPNSLREATEPFEIIKDEVPKLREYAEKFDKLKEMPWLEIAREIADGVNRQNAHLESAKDIMSIGQLRNYVADWRTRCDHVNKLISWTLFPSDKASKKLATLSRPGAYGQPFLN